MKIEWKLLVSITEFYIFFPSKFYNNIGKNGNFYEKSVFGKLNFL